MKRLILLFGILSCNLYGQEPRPFLSTQEVDTLTFNITYSEEAQALVFLDAFNRAVGQRFGIHQLLKEDEMNELCLGFEKLICLRPTVGNINDLYVKAIVAERLVAPQTYLAMRGRISAARPCKALFEFVRTLENELNALKRNGIIIPERVGLYNVVGNGPGSMDLEAKRQFELQQAKETLVRRAEGRAYALNRTLVDVTERMKKFLKILRLQNPEDFYRVRSVSGMTVLAFDGLVGPPE